MESRDEPSPAPEPNGQPPQYPPPPPPPPPPGTPYGQPYAAPYPPPPPPPPGYGMPYVAPAPQKNSVGTAVIVAIVCGVVGVLASIGISIWFFNLIDNDDRPSTATTFTPPSIPSIVELPPVVIPDLDATSTPQAPAVPGAPVDISGIDENQTVVCDGGDVTVGAIDNVIEITGACGSVSVSGSGNQVRVDSAAVISVSGLDNAVIYRDGAPQIDRSGQGNSVEQG